MRFEVLAKDMMRSQLNTPSLPLVSATEFEIVYGSATGQQTRNRQHINNLKKQTNVMIMRDSSQEITFNKGTIFISSTHDSKPRTRVLLFQA